MVNDKIYALPYEVEPMGMYYSVEAFEKAGLSEKDVPKTWDELLDGRQEADQPERFGVLFETNPGYYQNFTWYPFLWQGGGEIQTEDGKSAFNSPAAVQALKFWQDAVNMGVAPRKPLGGGGWDSVPNIGSGYCAMQNTGIWAIAQLREGAPELQIRHVQAADPSRRQGHDGRRRLGVRRQRARAPTPRPRVSSAPGRSAR